MNNFDWLGLAQAITYAHVEAQGYKVSGSRSECLLPRRVLNTADGVSGDAGSNPAAKPDGVAWSSVHDAADSLSLPNAQVQTCGLTKGRDAEIGNGGEGHSLSPLDRISCGGEVAHPSLERSVMPISPMAGSDRPTVRCGGEIRDLNTPAGMIHDGGTIERLIADVEKVQG